jgi:multidrug efflux pump subunit AcrA (membrane-fusion protein)
MLCFYRSQAQHEQQATHLTRRLEAAEAQVESLQQQLAAAELAAASASTAANSAASSASSEVSAARAEAEAARKELGAAKAEAEAERNKYVVLQFARLVHHTMKLGCLCGCAPRKHPAGMHDFMPDAVLTLCCCCFTHCVAVTAAAARMALGW